ncbi:hypothetical protein E2C01_070557 [Portunus trituberculatus]|uniref:Uncharacterized protein n=1 Tax=Portunus trituberculatus TaxID=210409 RepID=A0A5B7HXL9_PORTR|nr:hypothetical protein [Portunus trituberculatus]
MAVPPPLFLNDASPDSNQALAITNPQEAYAESTPFSFSLITTAQEVTHYTPRLAPLSKPFS